jgi:hypothetical protein
VSRLINNLTCAAAVGAFGLLALQAGPASAATGPVTTPPHIVATPNNLMINTKTVLTGTGFAPATKLVVEECSATSWIAPEDPCASSNIIHVRTTAAGNFKHSMTATICPSDGAPKPGFVQRCYVGVPHPFGVDQVRLLGATSLFVTGP